MVIPVSQCYQQSLSEVPVSCTLRAGTFLTTSGRQYLKTEQSFGKWVQSMCAAVHPEPTLKGAVEPVVMVEAHSHWLEFMQYQFLNIYRERK